jgi:hypothetical protein
MPDQALLDYLRWQRRVERQPKIFKHRLGAQVNPILEHPGPLADQIHGSKILTDEMQQFQRVVLHANGRLPSTLIAVNVLRQAVTIVIKPS